MAPDVNRIRSLCKDILVFREHLLNEIPEICDPDDYFFDLLCDHVDDCANVLNHVHLSLDRILCEHDC